MWDFLRLNRLDSGRVPQALCQELLGQKVKGVGSSLSPETADTPHSLCPLAQLWVRWRASL